MMTVSLILCEKKVLLLFFCLDKYCSFDQPFTSGQIAFDVEYSHWVEDQNRQISVLRAAVNAHVDDIFRLKANAVKNDVFHLLSGMWKTPAEKCFLWLGGFRSSELFKVRHLHSL